MLIKLNKIIQKYGLKINGVIHCGAHIGQEVPSYEDAGIKNIVLIEPCTDAYTELFNKYCGKYYLFNVALSDYNGEAEMFTTEVNRGQSNSLLKPALHETYYPDIIFDNKETVCVIRLDDLNISECNLLVMDLQGGELNALKGAHETLKHIDYIYTEVNSEELYENCAMVEELDNYLMDFKRVETKWAKRTTAWGDAFYISNKFL